jgi:hypothetical protein
MTHRSALSAFFSILFLILFGSLTLRAQANNPVPQINSLSPTAAAPGGAAFTLTVLGANFVSGSVVNWNGSPRATAFVSVTKLTAAISAADIATESTAMITVTNPALGGGVSNRQFFSIVPPASRINFSSTNITNQVAITSNVVEGDFNNDGKLDLAVVMGNSVFVLLGNGDGTFQSAISSVAAPGDTAVQNLYVADVNNDGKLDLYVTGYNSTTNLITTLFGKGDGTFNAPVETDISGSISFDFVFADFNQDGVLDAAFAANGNQIEVLLGNSDGSFRPGAVSTVGPDYPQHVVAAADFTGQGNLSLVVVLRSQTTSMCPLFLGVFTGSNGSFNGTPAATGFVGGCPNQGINAVVADFNGDGFPDIAALPAGGTFGTASEVDISLNTGNTTTPTFSQLTTVPGSILRNGTLSPLLTGDFNDDGILDLASSGFIYFGKGDGTFPTSTGSVSPAFLLAGDFNNDGKPDIIRDDPSSGQNPALGILLQIPPAPDFSGSISPSAVSASLNNTSNVTVTLQALYGFSSDVTHRVILPARSLRTRKISPQANLLFSPLPSRPPAALTAMSR